MAAVMFFEFERPAKASAATFASQLEKSIRDVRVEPVRGAAPNRRHTYVKVTSPTAPMDRIFFALKDIDGVENPTPAPVIKSMRATLIP
ncbi:hypothetical protein ACNJX9_09850 [Bradyrhizobium sp. DASA03076]|uniref:hypothetical protein n=1 Tax=Bradyrhizobium sp. BLXBL-03 TaxID=3395916 RepID=UPI003F7186FE